MSECRRFFVSGRVQGVFFRESTRREAERLALTGHAVNLDDGRVEVFACGSADALDQLARWLREGPSAAEVTDVADEAAEQSAPDGFTTG
jgi:acylphosphatase